jgi:hypothetical protein
MYTTARMASAASFNSLPAGARHGMQGTAAVAVLQLAFPPPPAAAAAALSS